MLELLAGEPLLAPRIFDGLVAELGDPFADHGVDLEYDGSGWPLIDDLDTLLTKLISEVPLEVFDREHALVAEMVRLRKTAPAVPMAPGRKSKKVKDK